MLVVFKRKQAVITIIICMIVVAGYINWAYQTGNGTDTEMANIGEMQLADSGDVKPVNAAPAVDTVQKAKDERNEARGRAMDTLKATMTDGALSDDARKNAESRYLAMASAMEKEGVCEGALTAKGIENSVVFISDGNISVSVKSENELTEGDITKIKDVIITATGTKADKIKISRIN